MKIRIFLHVLVLSISFNVITAKDTVLSTGTPAEAGMDEGILKAGVSLLQKAVQKDSLRNVVVLATRRGKIVLHEAIGWKDKAEGIRLKKDAMFRMASNTKPVVAAGVSILADEGKLNFNNNVRQYLPSFDNYRSGAIKIHHLLTHTSGLRIRPIFFKPLIEKSAAHPDAPSLSLEVDRFGETGAVEQPGKTYRYSNAGYNTLGALIEERSGKPLEVFLKERVYKPLGMFDSYHHEVAEKLDGKLERMSVVYYKRNGKWTEGWKPGSPPQYPFVRASGGMISTARDYAVFCQMFLNGGIYNGVRILKEETVKLITSPHTASIYAAKESAGLKAFYGYGWSVSKEGYFSHSGSDGTFAWIDPADELIVLVFTQSPNEKDLCRRFFRLVQISING